MKKRNVFFCKIINAFNILFKRKKKPEKKPKLTRRAKLKKIIKKKGAKLGKFIKKESPKTAEKLTTQIDELLEIVGTKKEVSIDEIASKLKQKSEKIEDWGRLLEEQGLVELVYPENPFKKPYLRRLHEEK